MITIRKKDIKENRIYQFVDGENYYLRYEGKKVVLLEAVGNRTKLEGEECMQDKDMFIKYFTLIPKRIA